MGAPAGSKQDATDPAGWRFWGMGLCGYMSPALGKGKVAYFLTLIVVLFHADHPSLFISEKRCVRILVLGNGWLEGLYVAAGRCSKSCLLMMSSVQLCTADTSMYPYPGEGELGTLDMTAYTPLYDRNLLV
jgi:hypothetical protein